MEIVVPPGEEPEPRGPLEQQHDARVVGLEEEDVTARVEGLELALAQARVRRGRKPGLARSPMHRCDPSRALAARASWRRRATRSGC